jgi:LTXXQ motif family protein
MAPRQMSPRQATPVQRFAAPRDGGPKGSLQRRVGIARDQGMTGKRSVASSNIRQQAGAKAKLAGQEKARQRAAERRQQIIERKQAASKARENLQAGKKENLQAGKKLDSTVGSRVASGQQSALVKHGKGDRQLMLSNRSLANLSARTPATRALAQSTFSGKFASHSHNWHFRHHRFHHFHHFFVIGWFGPLFWPFAYDDFVDYVFWPYAYDAFWLYAYDDVYDGFFGSYGVGGPAYAELPDGGGTYAGGGYASGGIRTGTRTGVGPRTATRGPAGAMAQVCTGETSGLTDWPVERIAQVVNPDESQRAALNELRDAAARAVELMRSACPDDLPSTPAGRTAAMRQRLEAMREAVQIVRPALDKFYAALSDEQRARFNVLEPEPTAAQAKARRTELSQVCSTAVTRTNAAPTARIQQALRLSAEQRTALDSLDAATDQAAKMLTANCPTEETLTPPGRLAAMEARFDAMLQALDVVQPALTEFYNSLSDEQKARFNQLGARRQAAR